MANKKFAFTDLHDWLLIKEIDFVSPSKIPKNDEWSTIASILKGNRLFTPPPTGKHFRIRVDQLLDRYENDAMEPRSGLSPVQCTEMDAILEKLSTARLRKREANEKRLAAKNLNKSITDDGAGTSAQKDGGAMTSTTEGLREAIMGRASHSTASPSHPLVQSPFATSTLLSATKRTYAQAMNGPASEARGDVQTKRLKLKEEELKMKREEIDLKKMELELRKEEQKLRKEELRLQEQRDAFDIGEREKRIKLEEARAKDEKEIRDELISIIKSSRSYP